MILPSGGSSYSWRGYQSEWRGQRDLSQSEPLALSLCGVFRCGDGGILHRSPNVCTRRGGRPSALAISPGKRLGKIAGTAVLLASRGNNPFSIQFPSALFGIFVALLRFDSIVSRGESELHPLTGLAAFLVVVLVRILIKSCNSAPCGSKGQGSRRTWLCFELPAFCSFLELANGGVFFQFSSWSTYLALTIQGHYFWAQRNSLVPLGSIPCLGCVSHQIEVSDLCNQGQAAGSWIR